jgi:hypothetical protein
MGGMTGGDEKLEWSFDNEVQDAVWGRCKLARRPFRMISMCINESVGNHWNVSGFGVL